MNNYLTNIALFLFGIIYSVFFVGCSKVEKLEKATITKSSLVLNGQVQTGLHPYFTVGNSLSSLDNAPLKEFKNAEIQVYENGIFVETVKWNGNFKSPYQCSLVAKPDFNYKVVVAVPGFTSISAECTTPRNPTVQNCSIEITGKYVDTMGNYINYYFQKGQIDGEILDIPNERNNYRIELARYYLGSKWYKISMYDWSFKSPGLQRNSEDMFTLNEILSTAGLYGTVRPYDYLVYYVSDNGYDGKPIPLHFETNKIKNYYGNNSKGLIDTLTKMEIRVTTMSEQLFAYENSLALYLKSRNDPISQPVQIFSNINNGLGILGAKSDVVKAELNFK